MTNAFYGPWLRFEERTSSDTWHLSALVVAKNTLSNGSTPEVKVDGTGSFKGIKLDSFAGYDFWRFSLSVSLEAEQRTHQYTLHLTDMPQDARTSYSFVAPPSTGKVHWGFKSCDWFSGGVSEEERARWGGYTPCWMDILNMHASNALHLMINGGDQLYCDPVFKEVEELKQWAELTDNGQMSTALKYKPTPDALNTISQWYFRHYCTSFQRDKILDVMCSIPAINMYDDHDICWGSYPASLQRCPMFQIIWQVAERFYLLFQQHTTKELAPKHGFFGAPGYHFVKQVTPEMAVLGMDMRAQRSLKHVIPTESHKLIMQQVNALPATVRHLIVISAVPVVYPEVPMSEMSMKCLTLWHQHVNTWAACQKKGSGGLFKFGQAELTDDLVDHWGSSCHRKERKAMIERFQDFAAQRRVRVSWISGDVHLAAVGLLYSQPKAEDPMTDPRWMLNVTSSASVNVPPPNGLVLAMTRTNHAHKVNHHTKEKMVRLFKDAPGTLSDKLMPRRNWCEVVAEPASLGGNMIFTLRVEPQGPEPEKPNFQFYSVTAPLVQKAT